MFRYLYSNERFAGTIPTEIGVQTNLKTMCVSRRATLRSGCPLMPLPLCLPRPTFGVCTEPPNPCVCSYLQDTSVSGTLPTELGQLNRVQRLYASLDCAHHWGLFSLPPALGVHVARPYSARYARERASPSFHAV